MLVVLDGMRRDYFDRYAASMPTLTAVRQRGAWFTQAEVNFIPTNTPVGHSTISTGADPAVHGITGVNVYDRTHHRAHELFAGRMPQDLMALTLADVWQLETWPRGDLRSGQHRSSGDPARRAWSVSVKWDAGRACQLRSANGRLGHQPRLLPAPAYLKDRNAKTLWQASAEWMGHRIDSTSAVRYSALVPAFEADALIAMIEHEPVGEDDVTDLILLNYKCADFVGHKYGPDSDELRVTLGEMDRQSARMLSALEAKIGKNYPSR